MWGRKLQTGRFSAGVHVSLCHVDSFWIKAWTNVPAAREKSTSLRPQHWRLFCQQGPEGALGTDLGCSPAGDPPKAWPYSYTSVRGTPHTYAGESTGSLLKMAFPTGLPISKKTVKFRFRGYSTQMTQWGFKYVCRSFQVWRMSQCAKLKEHTLPVSLSPRSEALSFGCLSHKTWCTGKDSRQVGQF